MKFIFILYEIVQSDITIDHHSIIAPNSAVDKDVESYTLVGGVPIKLIKKYEE